jgi:rhodanese-related sulfurtransferase
LSGEKEMTGTISAQEAAKMLAAGEAILIDVRDPDEFRAEHIAYATSLPLVNLENLIGHMHIPGDRKLIFQCLKGMRGQQACTRVKSCAICKNEIYNLEGGITAWKDAGLPVIGTSSGFPIFRQVQVIVGSVVVLMVVLGFMGLTLGFVIAGILGAALFTAGLTGWCGLAMILTQMPWNKS